MSFRRDSCGLLEYQPAHAMTATEDSTEARLAHAGTASAVVLWVMATTLAVAAFAILAVILGSDGNWDLMNYHLYGPYAATTGRIDIDHNPAGVPGYLNPALDILLTQPLVRYGSLHVLSAVLGGIQGLNLVLLAAIALHLFRGIEDRTLLTGLSAALGMSGAMVISEVGTTFADLTTATLVLGGLLCCLRGIEDNGQREHRGLICLGGFAMGLAAGFKLTNAAFLLALLVAVLVTGGARRFRTVALLGIFGFCGTLLSAGWWSWELWTRFGNPMFPFFNGVFQSPFFPPISFSDRRFAPSGAVEALLYPFYFSWNHQTAEITFRDFRFPIAYLLAVPLLYPVVFPREVDGRSPRRGVAIFSLFVIVSYAVWQLTFSIQRYAIAIELLIPAFAILALTRLSARHGRTASVAVALVLAWTTVPGDWGRVRGPAEDQPIVSEKLRAELSPVLDGAAIVLGRPPLAYLAPALRNESIVRFGNMFTQADAERARHKLAGRARVFTVSRAGEGDINRADRRLAALDLPTIGGADCREFSTTFDRRLLLCPVTGSARRRLDDRGQALTRFALPPRGLGPTQSK